MTWWMAHNEFKNTQFCQIHQLPKEYRYSYKLYCWPCHSARSKAESQNLIVILRIVKRSPRIYLRTDDGFCNSGQWCPPCRMTRWMADNEFKNPRFCQIHQLPRIFKFSHERSLLTLSFCAKRSGVAESLLYQNITTIPLNRAHELNFQPDFQVFLQTFKNPKPDFSSIDSVTSMIKTAVRSLFSGKIVSTLL